jgi:hypothetical protein
VPGTTAALERAASPALVVWPTDLGGELTWWEGLVLAGWSEGSSLLMVICLPALRESARAHLRPWVTRSRTSALVLGFLCSVSGADDDDNDVGEGDDDDNDNDGNDDDDGGASQPCSSASSLRRVDRHSVKFRVSRGLMPSPLVKSASFIAISRSGVTPWWVTA